MQDHVAPIKQLIRGMRIMLLIASLLVFSVGISLYILTEQTDRYFAWTIQSALTAAFLGAAYWSSCILEFTAAREQHWANARLAVPAVIVFTALTLGVTLVHIDRFHFNAPELMTRVGTWFWLAVYAMVPIILLILLVIQLRTPGGDPARLQPIPGSMRIGQGLIGLSMLLLGMVMLILPAIIIPIWPWTLTPLTARAIGAWLLGLGIAATHCVYECDMRRGRGVFLSSTVFFALQMIALLRYPDQFDWGSPAGMLYVIVLMFIGIIGILGVVFNKLA